MCASPEGSWARRVVNDASPTSLDITPGRPKSNSKSSTMIAPTERQLALATLAEDEQRAAILKDQLDILQSEYDAAIRSIVMKRNQLAAIALLPPELLGEVFVYTSEVDEVAPVVLSHVCRSWRQTVRSTPRAWCHIHIRLKCKNPVELAGLFFELSKACALHVALTDPPKHWNHCPPLKLVSLALSLRENWHRIKIFRMYRVGTPLTKTILQFCRRQLPEAIPGIPTYPPSSTPLPTPSVLRHVAIHLESNFEGEVAEGVDLTNMNDLFGDTSGIATFCLENGIPSYDLPLFTFGGLKSIQIEEPERPGYSTPMLKVMSILAASPDLHVFILAGNKSSEDGECEDIRGTPSRIISLPALRILSLQSIDIPHLLDHIKTPSLEKLKLGNELQSGWHHSVASSLRNLIHRSGHPHITRLRINDLSSPQSGTLQDWACFDALPHLVSFRIHHTHFPDHLLQALTVDPVSVIREQEHSVPQSPLDLNPKFLCPKLSKLVFENCDFSGAALIKFVKSRKAIQSRLFEEAMAQGKQNDLATRNMIEHCQDISELWIGTCPMVADEDVGELRMLMGQKFQSSLSPGASESQ